MIQKILLGMDSNCVTAAVNSDVTMAEERPCRKSVRQKPTHRPPSSVLCSMQLNKSYFGRKKAYFSGKTNYPTLLTFEGDGKEQKYLSTKERKQIIIYTLQCSNPCYFIWCLFNIKYGMVSHLTGAMLQIRICNVLTKPKK